MCLQWVAYPQAPRCEYKMAAQGPEGKQKNPIKKRPIVDSACQRDSLLQWKVYYTVRDFVPCSFQIVVWEWEGQRRQG